MGVDYTEAIGIVGMLLVFASFVVKDWRWLYSFNLSGAVLLTLYAYLRRDGVFFVVELGISAFLAYRLVRELRSGGPPSSYEGSSPGKGKAVEAAQPPVRP